MCHSQLKPEIQYTSVVAQAILETSGRGSFIAPAVGFLHYGPSCYLYDHVCNFNYQGESSSAQRGQLRCMQWLVSCKCLHIQTLQLSNSMRVA